MDNPSHRQILRALRPHGADRLDPEAQSALAAAQADPALSSWLEREQNFDRAFADRVQSAAAPAELRAAIFARVEADARRTHPPARRIVVHRPVATFFAALAAAASVALLAIVLWPQHSRPATLDDVVASALETPPSRLEVHELAGRPMADVRDWLAGKAAPVPGEIPPALAALPTDGAGMVVLKGITASVVTFRADGFSGADTPGSAPRLALFTLPRQSCSSQGLTRAPVVREQAGHALAVWRDATSVYVLAVDASADDLRHFLATGRTITLLVPRQIVERQPG